MRWRALIFQAAERRRALERACDLIDDYARDVADLPVAPPSLPEEVRAFVEAVDFERPLAPEAALEHLAEGLRRHQVHTSHPRYFGLFNPAPTTMGVAADALVAAFNPQMATWSHGPMGCEVERYLMRALGERFGYERAIVEGTFCSGGAEANHTALAVALAATFPALARDGLRALPAQPVLYVSREGHHSIHKAARVSGLGEAAVRVVEVDEALGMRPEALAARVAEDRAAGLAPFLVIATAGTTNAGALDPLPALAEIAESDGLWLHVDAAWGGGAARVAERR
jgi:aromatic-L-amino-acid/L-tryptophan decarboxylase